ncbi:MAG: TonB-dependent receptor [Campylobacter sp.]|nr:TonB-dependent receptor [Campylobacter sp.]
MLKSKIFILIFASVNLYAADNNVTKLDEVIITATGFESFLRDEVRNVTIITSDDLQERGYRDINEALEKAPGVSYIYNGAGRNIDIRGQGQKANTSVKVLVNGIAINMIDTTPTSIHTDLIPIEDVERIEIIPGGGSVLYGSGTTGGIINIITKQKVRDFFATASTKIASYSYKDFNFAVGGKVSDALYLKTAVKNFNTDGYRYGEWLRGYYANLGINYQINDMQSISINPSYFKAKEKSARSLSKLELNENRRQAAQWSDTVSRRVAVDVNYNAKFGDEFELTLTPYYQKETDDMDSDTKFEDKKLGSNFKGRYIYSSGEIVAGYEYLKNDGLRILDVSMGAIGRNYTKFDMQKRTHSFYIMPKYDFTDYFSLNAGYRYEKALYDVDRLQRTTMMGRTTRSMFGDENDISNYAFEITPNFKYSNTGNVYFKFERGYTSPGPNQLVDKPNRTTYAINNLRPETFKTYEIGMKDMLLGGYFSAAVFYTDTKDEIRNIALTANISDGWHFINIDKTRRYGFELYADQHIFNKLRLSETYSFVDAEIKSADNSGKRIPWVQKSKFVLGVDYEPIKNLNLLTDVKWFSSVIDSYYDKIDDKTIVDFGAKYKFRNGISIIAGIKNLFDKKYNLVEIKQADSYSPAPERNYYVEFKYAY